MDVPFPVQQHVILSTTDTQISTQPVISPASRSLSPESLKLLNDSSTISTRIRTDPLSDEKFIASHRRGEREERHYQNFERDKVMYEKLRFERQLDRLNGHDWIKVVLSMTPVSNPRDDTELSTKRDRLVLELEAVLKKFDRWKEKEKKLKSMIVPGLANRDLEMMKERLEQRKTALRILNDDVSPARAPRGRPKQPRQQNLKAWMSSPFTISGASQDSIVERPQNKPRVKKEASPKPIFYSKHRYRSPRAAPLAFGQPVPKMSYRQFGIPNEWVQNREKLRRSEDAINDIVEQAEGNEKS